MENAKPKRGSKLPLVAGLLLGLAFVFGTSGPDGVREEAYAKIETVGDTPRWLLCPLWTFTGNGRKVILSGEVHYADPAYYRAVNDLMAGADRVFYEGLTGDTNAALTLPTKMERLLDYEHVSRHIPNDARHLNVDISKTEFAVMVGAARRSPPDTHGLATAATDAAARRLALAKIICSGRGLVDCPEVVIEKRNDLVRREMTAEFERGAATIGLRYGVAHFGDLAQSLKKQGFTVEKSWLRAWDLRGTAR